MKQFKFNERQRFSIRKFSMGAASVLLGSVFFAVSSVEDVQAAEQSQNVVGVNENKQTPDPVILSNSSTTGVSTEETNTSVSAANVENKPEGDVVGISKETLNKTALTKLIEDIDGKFTNGKYASKTEDSVNQLKTALDEAKSVLNNAKIQEELTRAYNKLVTVTTQLKTKPEEKKEAPAVDTTNGKATVGIKATNTEKATESNSIPNSGSKDERNGKALNTNNPFRTDATTTTTDTDPAANQTYTLPGDSASVGELADKLQKLDSSISNETKLASIDEVGRLKSVQPGKIQEIDEFGGWSAITADGNKGKFAIARKTDTGVYPIETVNVTRKGAGENGKYVIHVQENAFDRSNKYALFLSKVRTYETQNEETFDKQPFKDVDTNGGVGEALQISRGLKGFNGIEKTYKAYSPSTGTGINISFKTGFTGDIDGVKAGYRVEVIAKFKDGRTESIYNESFRPTDSINNGTKHVVPVDANDNVKFEVKRSSKPSTDDLNQQLARYKNSQENKTGSFTSKTIDLPKGAIEYTVRISASDNSRLGMGYQTTWSQYALPVTGTDFSIEQDTGAIAKKLLSRIYDKLKATETADTDGKTNETKTAYLAELEKVKTLVTSTDVKKTAEYKEALESTLSKQLALRVDKTELRNAKEALSTLVTATDPTPGKTADSAKVYNDAKVAAQEAIQAAETVINDENATVAGVRDALATVNAKKTALQQAKDGLIAAATTAEKAKLKADVDSLMKADTTGKTPKSIDEYNKEFKKFEQDFNSIKTEVSNIIAKGNNATEAEVDTALSKVAEIKTKLDTAAGSLVNKGNKTELERVVGEESTVKGNFEYYNADKTKRDAYDSAINNGNTVIKDPNATQSQVAAALKAITEAKQALDGTETNKDELQRLVNEAANKATDAKYYNAEQGKKDAYDQAITKAQEVLNKANVTQAEINAEKGKVETAKNALDGTETNKAQLTNNNNVLNELISEDPTNGKTKATIDEYKKVKEESEKLLKEIKKVIDNKNASQIEVNKALEMVVKAKDSLENAKKSLLDAVEAREVVETIANEKLLALKQIKNFLFKKKKKQLTELRD